jgi:phage terminase large subunit-like protein
MHRECNKFRVQLLRSEHFVVTGVLFQHGGSPDMAFKDLSTSDYVVGQVWGAAKADRFLLDQRRERMDMPSTKEAVKDLSRRWPKAGTKLVEDKRMARL